MSHEPPDAYHVWLGIPPSEQPPNHYRLLSVELFENQPEIIAHAADRQMAHLRALRSGSRAPLAQKLLNEVATAKACLLSSEKKAAYDLALRLALSGEEKPRADAQPSGREDASIENVAIENVAMGATSLSSSARAPMPAEDVGAFQIETGDALQRCRTRLGGRRGASPRVVGNASRGRGATPPSSRARRLAIESVLCLLAFAGLAILLTVGRGWWAGDSGKATPRAKNTSATTSHLPRDFAQQPKSNVPADVESPKTSAHQRRGPRDIAVRAARPSSALSRQDHVADSALPGSAEQRKHTVPSRDAQQRIAQELEERIPSRDVDGPNEHRNRAKRLADEANRAQGNPDERYILLLAAARAAGDSGDAAWMLEFIDVIDRQFAIDAVSVKRDLLTRFADRSGAGGDPSSLVAASRGVIAQAVNADRYELALTLAKSLSLASQRSRARHLMVETRELRLRLERLHQQWRQAERARATLQSDPRDKNANGLLGRWYCFVKRDWGKGLPYLARGGDDALASLAERELAAHESAEAELALADAWWDAARTATGDDRTLFLVRAADWYEGCFDRLRSGLDRLRVRKRLEQVALANDESRPDLKPSAR
ncbi:MAG: hypothetical protein JW809_15025 [Pirellulales bacterium]|nr:hypothetical protein [Pirellulales bacterium]